jgi:hypothetical protein
MKAALPSKQSDENHFDGQATGSRYSLEVSFRGIAKINLQKGVIE